MKPSVVFFRLIVFLSITIPGGRLVAADLKLPAAIRDAFRISGACYEGTSIGFDSKGNEYLGGHYCGAIPFVGFRVPAKTTLGPVGGYPGVFVAEISGAGDRLLNLTEISDSNAAYDTLGGLQVEPDGSVVLTGRTQAADFPTTAGSFQPHATNGGAFLLKLDSSGQKIVFSTYLDDSTSTVANSVAIAPDGSYYLAGGTDGKTFPTTVGAYQRSLPTGASGGFVSRISRDGSTLLTSTLFDDAGSLSSRGVTSVAVDRTGAVHLLGSASLAILDPSLSELSWSKPIDMPDLLEIDQEGNSYVISGNTAIPAPLDATLSLNKFAASGALLLAIQIPPVVTAFTVLEDGSMVLAGFAGRVNFRTRNSVMPCNMNVPHDTVPVQWWLMSATLIVLDPSGNVVNASFMGGGAPAGYGNDGNGFSAIATDQTGMVHLAGSSSSLDFPGGASLIPGPANASTFGFALDLEALPQRNAPTAACLAFSAPWGPIEAPVVPAMFMTLFGSDLGPALTVSSQLDSNQRVPTEVAGVRLTVGGLPAPILSVQEGQIDFIVPHGVMGPTTNVCITRNSGHRQEVPSCLFAYVGDRDGAMLSGVLNEDGTVNSSTNPALPGSVVSFFGIGFDVFDPAIPDGALTHTALASTRYSIEASFTYEAGTEYQQTVPAEVLYFGTAPGLLNGVVQMNIRLPAVRGSPIMNPRVMGGTVPAFPLQLLSVFVYT